MRPIKEMTKETYTKELLNIERCHEDKNVLTKMFVDKIICQLYDGVS